ncbi:nucleotide-diphospho-sugar transferase [Lipomyces tetrasporus]|uniref:Translation initiation factor eIF2B subunit epsilon n=1 Tax=Lipomyces tetrasporus TaxID=54092 RepID=A0AAD7VRY5_9ASCO|nr:nucleotide-diphospho-sugar transferase [Lipomyces tetrasporus]KAJ8100477.1 nucleotide-diphospho-sugar transferase [Lipomyces tetrasporus]
MGPKKGGQAGGNKAKVGKQEAQQNTVHEETDQDQRLQAIVLSDSYQTRFQPLTLETPRCLLPLCNTPLLEYTFEFLALAGVSEVIVVCCAHADQIQEYIANSRWSNPSSPFTIETVLSPESVSVGDAMRDLDAKGLITSDFLLVSGDIVCNVPFDKVLAEHRRRRAKDKNAIMTMVLREASPLHRTRARAESAIFVLDEQTNQCVHYEDIKTRKHQITLDPEIFNKHTDLSIRNDFIDCHIDICSPDVPALFTENFDYNHIRKDFVHGILTSDLLGKTIFAHIVTDNYAARVRSLQTYDAVSKDVISRWTYPITPDSNLLADQTFQYQRGHIYKEDDIVLARSCRINSCTVIGAGTVVHDGTVITGSVIGRRCKIGKNVLIQSAYIWDEVTIEDDAIIESAIIAKGAIIGASSHVAPGAIVSYNVKIGENIVVDGNKRLTKYPAGEERNINTQAVGEDGDGYVYEDDSEAEEDDDYEEIVNSSGLVYNMASLNGSDTSFSTTSTDQAHRKPRRRRFSTASSNTIASEESDEDSFLREAQASVERAIAENHDLDIAALELSTLRMAKNAQFHEVRAATITALIGRISHLINSNTLKARAAVESVLNRWGPLFRRQVFDQADQIDFLLLIQRDCTRRMQGSSILLHAINCLYDQDILEEEAILKWWHKEPQRTEDADMVKVGELVPRWLEWLTTAEEESESE